MFASRSVKIIFSEDNFVGNICYKFFIHLQTLRTPVLSRMVPEKLQTAVDPHPPIALISEFSVAKFL